MSTIRSNNKAITQATAEHQQEIKTSTRTCNNLSCRLCVNLPKKSTSVWLFTASATSSWRLRFDLVSDAFSSMNEKPAVYQPDNTIDKKR